MGKNSAKSVVMLFLTALIWGAAFVWQSKSMEYMRPFTFMAARNILATIFLMPLVIYKAHKCKMDWHITIKGGILCGIALTAADFCQQYGITMTSVGKTGFITTLYIIFTPILGVFLHKRIGLKIWLCALVSMVGMYLICMTDSFKISRGDTLVFVCAILFAVHILVIDNYAPYTDGVVVSCIQFFTCFVICAILALVFDKPSIVQIGNGIIPVLYAGIVSSGIGYTLQTVGQKGVNPTVAALILSLESVVAAVAGYYAYRFGILSTDQTLTATQIAGCVTVFAAVIMVQLPDINLRRIKK